MLAVRCIFLACALALGCAIDYEDGVSLLQKQVEWQHGGADELEDITDNEYDGVDEDDEMTDDRWPKCRAWCFKDLQSWKKKCKQIRCMACKECSEEQKETLWPRVVYTKRGAEEQNVICKGYGNLDANDKGFKAKNQLQCQAAAIDRGMGFISYDPTRKKCFTCDKFHLNRKNFRGGRDGAWQVFRNPASCSNFPSKDTCVSTYCTWRDNTCVDLYQLTAKGAGACGAGFEQITNGGVCLNAGASMGLSITSYLDNDAQKVLPYGCLQLADGSAAYSSNQPSFSWSGTDFAGMLCIRSNPACKDEDDPCLNDPNESFCESGMDGLTGQQQCFKVASELGGFIARGCWSSDPWLIRNCKGTCADSADIPCAIADKQS